MAEAHSNARDFAARRLEKLDLSRAWQQNPFLWEAVQWRPCVVRILLVADGFLYFSDEDFGLSDLIGVLKDEPFPFVRFEISTAHRTTVSSSANPTTLTRERLGIGNPRLKRTLDAFNFADRGKFDPSLYDQVWLFGSVRSRLQPNGQWSDRLSDPELRALSEFMNDGGGVFATGDHEDLGCAMGGFLPRVRAMRRWFYPGEGPNGEELAPPFDGSGRFDTNREGPTAGFQFDDQSDVIPQVIEPNYYFARTFTVQTIIWPHPLLCGPAGVITILPDHPHESQCTTAAKLKETPVIDGLPVTEFPPATNGGAKPIPELVAWSRVIGGHTTSGKTGTTVANRFGAIAAYDGHRSGVGRVVTDATWHHFINVNLTGTAGGLGDKAVGFLATPAGQEQYAKIQAYFRNIALWLARPQKVVCMRNWSLVVVLQSHRLKEVFDPDVRLETARIFDLITIGRHARDALGRYASQCQAYRWLLDLVMVRIVDQKWFEPIDPWAPIEELEKGNTQFESNRAGFIDLEWLGEAVLGGAVLALRDELFPLDAAQMERTDDDVLEKLVDTGAQRALGIAGRSLRDGLSGFQRFAELLVNDRNTEK